MNFPTQQHWFNFVWPELSPARDGDKILVPVHRHTNLEDVDMAATANPTITFMLAVEDFDSFGGNMPATWRRMSSVGDGGIPPNVWVGASINSQKEADERMHRLVKIRARVLFLMLKKGHPQVIDLKAGLIAWRCTNCGRRDGYNRFTRPKVCPSGTMCDGALLGPQIHWVVSMDPYKSSHRSHRCERLGVAFWDNQSMQVPE
jgi:hypothetical protein